MASIPAIIESTRVRLRREFTGRGLGTEAAGRLIDVLVAVGVARVEIRCHPENRPSRAIPERLGLQLEAILPNAIRMTHGGRGPAEVWVREVVDGT